MLAGDNVVLERRLGGPAARQPGGLEAHGVRDDPVTDLEARDLAPDLDDLAGHALARDKGVGQPFPLLVANVLLGPVHGVDSHSVVLHDNLIRSRPHLGRLGAGCNQPGTLVSSRHGMIVTLAEYREEVKWYGWRTGLLYDHDAMCLTRSWTKPLVDWDIV